MYTIPISDVKKPRVGIVGEILVKFLPAANNHLADLLESEGAEAVVPDLIDFMCYCFYNQNFKVENLGFKKSKATMANWGIKAIPTVDITGRDQQDQKLYLKFDPKLCLWKFEKAETELWKEPEDKVLSAVNTYLMEAGCFQGQQVN